MSKILIACEESQTVCKAFRALGHEAYSCDTQPCSGGFPEHHIQDDIFHVLQRLGISLSFLGGHPPCTYSANSGVRWLYNKDGNINKERWDKMEMGATFTRSLLSWVKTVGCGYIEQPILHKHALAIIGERPTQIIQPWQFGHGETKATCLWLVGLPKLVPTNIVEGREGKVWRMPPGPDRAKMRSKTFQGIAHGMANQWGALITPPSVLEKESEMICNN